MLSQESRIKLQNLINYPMVTSVSIQDRRVIYSPGNAEVYARADIHATCELETMQVILDESGISYGKTRDFECEHEDHWSIGHIFNGTIEGCNISFIVTRNIKKAPADAEGPKENFLPDNNTEVWTVEEILRREA